MQTLMTPPRGQVFSDPDLFLSDDYPPADGGYPVDADLDRMTDDGGPLSPTPARWSDLVWGDAPTDPGEMAEPPSVFAVAGVGVVAIRPQGNLTATEPPRTCRGARVVEEAGGT